MSRGVRVRDTCIGIGVCESIAPQLFTLGDGEQARTLRDVVAGNELDDADDAAASCPMSAIEIDGE